MDGKVIEIKIQKLKLIKLDINQMKIYNKH